MDVYLPSRFHEGQVWWAGRVPGLSHLNVPPAWPGRVSFVLQEQFPPPAIQTVDLWVDVFLERLDIPTGRVRRFSGGPDLIVLMPPDLETARKIPGFVEQDLVDDWENGET